MWGHYIDDVLLLWDRGEEEFADFVQYLNSVHPTIKFTEEHSVKQISFLDTLILKDEKEVYTWTSL